MNFLMPPPGRRLDLARYEPALPVGTPVQEGFEDFGSALHEATFVVVDLETTGGSPVKDRITEIGAVKVRGGEVLGEFASLINPGVAIPPQITVLTGITTAMVINAPRIEEVLPSFLEFSHGAIIVAHNARFDIGFLRAASKALGLHWKPAGQVDTLALARRVVTKDEAPNHKLGSLARLFGAQTTPDHRALSDARATVDVFHGLLERLGPLGVTHVEDLNTAADPVPAHRRRRVKIAANLPQEPGVYLFKDSGGQALYVGTAKNLRRRVRQYFTSAPDRRRIGEMVDLSANVDVIVCPTVIEAQIRELRLIEELDPPYNRRSKRPHQKSWVRLTDEPLPRASIVRSVPLTGVGIGPFPSRRQAQEAVYALEDLGLRSCTVKLPELPSPSAQACAQLALGRCVAPCVDAGAVAQYQEIVTRIEEAFLNDVGPSYNRLATRMRELAGQQRFEDAARVRDRLTSLLRGIRTSQELDPLWKSTNTIAARWNTLTYPGGAWEMVVVRYGRLAASGVCPPSHNPLVFAHALSASAAHVSSPTRLGGAASAEETTLLLRWLNVPGSRLIAHEGEPLAFPRGGPQPYLDRLTTPAKVGA